ncbi:MAG: hypothetical protein P1P84_05350 [Deferrisomatales bacterium]|nr:hypothetical protein [Deferrisomatales bacterium]
MPHVIRLPTKWVNASTLERTLQLGQGPHEVPDSDVRFIFPAGCKVMIDAAVRLLSLLNQLDRSSRRVRLEFEDGASDVLGYLNRMGFFDHLARNVEVVPERPPVSAAKQYGGQNAGLVEIAAINPSCRDDSLPSRLSDALGRACCQRSDVKELEGAAWTVFAELVDNVFSHSATSLDGYAALQVYSRGKSLMVAVSDSGLGIMETLRPAISAEFPTLAGHSDIELLVEVFRQGLSRHGSDRGCGLKGSAAKAIKYKADLDVRLPTNRVLLVPGAGGYRPSTAYCSGHLPLIWGTHLCFTFSLDT